MPDYSSHIAPHPAASPPASSAEATLPPPRAVERRQFIRQAGERLNGFTAALKTNAAWMKRFLHRAK